MNKQRLAIPGPTPVSERVLAAMHRQPIGHRAPEFSELLYSIYAKLGQIFRTERPVHTFASPGTGVMVAAADNFFKEGDRVLVLVNGLFGERFLDICRRHRLFVEGMDFEWGGGISLEALEERLSEDKNKMIKGVFFQHNETSTGVLNGAENILGLIGNHGALSIVDAISGVVAAPFYQDEWGADVVLGASQKGFMMAPGLAFMSASERAISARKRTSPRNPYLDIQIAEKTFETGNPYCTPAVNSMFGLDAALDMLLEEGLENCWERHTSMMRMVRSRMRAWQLDLLAEDEDASPSVTAVRFSQPGKLEKLLKEKYNIIISGGYGKLDGKIFRLAHLGYVDEMDMEGILSAFKNSLYDLGYFFN